MADSFSQIYIQIIFAVKHRNAVIHSSWEERLYQYMAGTIQNKGQKLIAINGMPDHIHIFIGMKTNCNLSDLVREVKKSSTAFINENQLAKQTFHWQQGFGAFSYGHSQINTVYNYVINQKEHHKKKTFKEEYLDFLKKFDIEFKTEYLFDWIGD